ncbi:MAG: hypothetical protein HC913_02100 [Microscillaceae bacterium]|nr:hypothetical protein [Microscillaceae bacterium]
MFFPILLGVLSASLAYGLKSWHKKQRKAPTLRNLRRFLAQLPPPPACLGQAGESAVEEWLSRLLQKRFVQVQTQYPVAGPQSRRERVDIDLGEGQLGIEIKMAEMLRKGNERNRFLGQIELYRQRRYGEGQLLVILFGPAALAQEPSVQEVLQILANKKVGWHFIPAS